MRAHSAAPRILALTLAAALVLPTAAAAAETAQPVTTTTTAAPVQPPAQPGTAFTLGGDPVTLETASSQRSGGQYDSRSYGYPDGARLTMARFRTGTQPAPAQDLGKITLDGDTGVLRRYDLATSSWVNVPLQAGNYPAGTYHLSTAQGSAILVTPQGYTDHGNGMIEHLPACDGTLHIAKTAAGFLFTLRTPTLPAYVHSEWLLLRSAGQLVDWTNPDSLEKWSIYCFTGDNRWCLNGYYYLAPESYYPYGPNYYHNLPAAYIAGRMMRDNRQPASVYLGLAMLDVMGRLRNAEGYLPSLAGSTWLHDDYGIEPGYFDTRFNVDFAAAQLNAVTRYEVKEWEADLIRFGDYLCGYAARHHFSFDEMGEQGWLVQDYAHKDGGKPTHSSLNHHAAQAVYLYRLTELTDEPRFAETAEILTRGIEHTAQQWLKEDGDLHYSYQEDGTFGRTDYPYLTYNDLLELQSYVADWRGVPSGNLHMLLESKRQWMDANGITEYNK